MFVNAWKLFFTLRGEAYITVQNFGFSYNPGIVFQWIMAKGYFSILLFNMFQAELQTDSPYRFHAIPKPALSLQIW
jgi:hypothetical protein